MIRQIAENVEELSTLPNKAIIRSNDLIAYIYILHTGEIGIYGPNDEFFDILTRGR